MIITKFVVCIYCYYVHHALVMKKVYEVDSSLRSLHLHHDKNMVIFISALRSIRHGHNHINTFINTFISMLAFFSLHCGMTKNCFSIEERKYPLQFVTHRRIVTRKKYFSAFSPLGSSVFP